MFHLISGIPWLVVAARFLLPLPWHLSIKIALAALLLIASQYHYFSRLSSGSVFDPEFPRPIVIAFNVLMATVLILAILQILLDVVSVLAIPVKGHFPVVPPGVRYAMATVALCLSAFGVYQATRVPALKDVEIKIEGLPAAFDGYQVVQLTDLHISRLFPRDWAAAVVARTNELNADLILMTGDLIDGSVEHRSQDVAPISQLHARDGVYSVPGNHEYFFDNSAWMQEYQRLNLRPLLNSHTVIDRGGSRIVIAGVTDRSAARFGATPPDLAVALQGAPANAPVVLLDHQPMAAAISAETGVDLQLSGHTHGGMVTGLDRLVARANNGFVSGLYRVGNMQLYVSSGTALWPGFAIRIGILPELTRITLRKAANS
jgi:predicted MPP superfamily phosphohydrolase